MPPTLEPLVGNVNALGPSLRYVDVFLMLPRNGWRRYATKLLALCARHRPNRGSSRNSSEWLAELSPCSTAIFLSIYLVSQNTWRKSGQAVSPVTGD